MTMLPWDIQEHSGAGTLIGPCVGAAVAMLVFGAVAAPAEEPASMSDMTAHQTDMTGTTPFQDSKEESAITTNPSGAGTIGPETERQLSVPDDRPGAGRGPHERGP